MISVGENKAVICKGDFHPAQLYKGDKKIAGYTVESFEGENGVTLENCYNDKLHNAQIYGNSVQDGTPTPDTPVEVQSVGELVTEGEYTGKYKVPVKVRGKNLFEYTSNCSYVQSGSNVKQTVTGAIVKGNVNQSGATNSWARGWYTPGYLKGNCPVLYAGDVVTISADVTLMELRQDSSYNIQVHLYARNTSGYADDKLTTIPLNKTTSIKRTYTITNYISGKIFYPCFVLNSNVVKIENIQIEYGDTATSYEPYIEPQTFNIYLDEPLRGIKKHLDYIDFDKGVVVRNLGEITVTSDMVKKKNNWYYQRNWNAYQVLFSDFESYFNQHNSGDYSNYFSPTIGGYTSAHLGSNYVFQLSEGIELYIITTPASDETVEEIRAWVDEKYNEGKPLKFTLRRAEPIEEAIDLPKLPTFKGTTVIKIDTDVTATVSGKYKRTEV